jgi:alkylation response protein AidB-like acyl-CoA dehydrogenase
MTATTSTERAGLLEMASNVARHELLPRAGALDAGDLSASKECWDLLAELGLDRALLPEEHGGDLSVPDLLATIEELAVGDGGVALCVLLSNTALVTLTPDQLAAVPERARWALVPVRDGVEMTFADGALTGRVESALGAYGADGLVLLLDGAQPTSIALASDTPGLELERDAAQMGLCAAPAGSIAITGIAVAPATTAKDGADALSLLCAGTAAIARGISRRANAMAFEYAEARRQGGVAIIEHDAVSDMLAAMAVRLAGPPPSAADWEQALAAKVAATDDAVASTTDAVQVFGGTGYMCETGIEKLMRDAKYCQLFPEPNWLTNDKLMKHQRACRGTS